MSAQTTLPPNPNLEEITKELYKKNLALVSANKEFSLLQKLYEVMMQEFDVASVAEHFINVIVKDLGFDSGLVVLKDREHTYLNLAAVTLSAANTKALEAIQKPFSELRVSLHSRDNKLVKAYLNKKRYFTHHLGDIVQPALTQELTAQISEITQIQSTAIYPLIFGKKKLGVFTISTTRLVKDLTSYEREILKRITFLFGVALDRVMLYQALQVANKKLKMLDKRKDEFLSVAAHELRAPLTAVKGYLSMIKDGDGGRVPKKMADFMQGAIEGAEREIRLVNNLLDASRIEEGHLVYAMNTVRLHTVIQFVYTEFKLDAAQKGLEFLLTIEDHLRDKVYVDTDRIHEIVANFVSNALKYTDQGSVFLALYNPHPDKKTIRFEVSDTGYGMTAEEQKKLFRKFYRAESSAGKALGTGLGLYTTKLLVETFEGNLGVTSAKGKGSTFWFELPVAAKK